MNYSEHFSGLLDNLKMTMPTEKPYDLPAPRKNENRKTSKPLMEKRRRARINHSLSELKSLILDAVKKDTQHTQHSRLEKADILEMTVRYLQNLHRQNLVNADPVAINKFCAGYSECAREVSRFVRRMETTDPIVGTRIVEHISRCLASLNELQTTERTCRTPQSNLCPASPSRPSSNESCSSSSTSSGVNLMRIDIPSSSSPSPEGFLHYPPSSPPSDSRSILVTREYHPPRLLTTTSVPVTSNAVPVITSQLPNGHMTTTLQIVGASRTVGAYDFSPMSPLNLVTNHREDATSRSTSSSSSGMSSPSFMSRSSPATPVGHEPHRASYAKDYHSDSEMSVARTGHVADPTNFQGTSHKTRLESHGTNMNMASKAAELAEQGDNVWRPW